MTGPNAGLLPSIAITVGDVAGVGPELALRCAALPEITRRCRPILYGPTNAIDEIGRSCGIERATETREIGEIELSKLTAGQFSEQTGRASYLAVRRAVEDALSGDVQGVVTGPIQKEAWHDAGIRFPGHTELLAEMTGVDEFCMMLTSQELSCVLVTIHVPLADVAAMLSVESVLRAIRLGADALGKRLGRPARVKVCGLNPHAGENGMFSHGEERDVIEPAISRAREMGLHVEGPLPPDTAFTARVRSETDVYVCMYHDQGLIPLKALAFEDAVNVTLGLPIVRTSVDHGTALDLAWQGKADHRSMLAALHLAIDLGKKPASGSRGDSVAAI